MAESIRVSGPLGESLRKLRRNLEWAGQNIVQGYMPPGGKYHLALGNLSTYLRGDEVRSGDELVGMFKEMETLSTIVDVVSDLRALELGVVEEGGTRSIRAVLSRLYQALPNSKVSAIGGPEKDNEERSVSLQRVFATHGQELRTLMRQHGVVRGVDEPQQGGSIFGSF